MLSRDNISPMPDMIECSTHGQCQATYVCSHLPGESAGLGFNRDEPTEENPFPDAWCDDCEIIREGSGGWNEQSEKLAQIVMLCSGCYERARIRHTRTNVTLDDLKNLRWKCSTCEEWHTGPALDFSYFEPHYWTREHADADRKARMLPSWLRNRPKTFLTEDFCAINDEYFFVRGLIHLPIIGAGETFRWGVWGSLSRENFEKLLEMDEDPKRTELPSMFSWLSSRIGEYPDTLSLKMYAHIQPVGSRPHFFLEPSDHPLAKEYHHGITAERVKEIMMRRLRRE